jgi:hypothetical protein
MKHTKIRACLVVLLCLSFLGIDNQLARGQNKQTPSKYVSHGTLIVAIPTREGIVICGDRRVHSNGGDTDNEHELKIRRLDSRSVYAASGVLYATTDRGEYLFSLYSAIENSLPSGLASYWVGDPLPLGLYGAQEWRNRYPAVPLLTGDSLPGIGSSRFDNAVIIDVNRFLARLPSNEADRLPFDNPLIPYTSKPLGALRITDLSSYESNRLQLNNLLTDTNRPLYGLPTAPLPGYETERLQFKNLLVAETNNPLGGLRTKDLPDAEAPRLQLNNPVTFDISKLPYGLLPIATLAGHDTDRLQFNHLLVVETKSNALGGLRITNLPGPEPPRLQLNNPVTFDTNKPLYVLPIATFPGDEPSRPQFSNPLIVETNKPLGGLRITDLPAAKPSQPQLNNPLTFDTYKPVYGLPIANLGDDERSQLESSNSLIVQTNKPLGGLRIADLPSAGADRHQLNNLLAFDTNKPPDGSPITVLPSYEPDPLWRNRALIVDTNIPLGGLRITVLPDADADRLRFNDPLIFDSEKLLTGRTVPGAEPDRFQLSKPSLIVNTNKPVAALPIAPLPGGPDLQFNSLIVDTNRPVGVPPIVTPSRDSMSATPLVNSLGSLVWPNLARQLVRNLGWLVGTDVRNLPRNPSNELFEIRFFYLDPNNKLNEEIIVCTYDTLGNTITQLKVTYLTGVDDLNSAKPLLSGSPEVYNEISAGSREDFSDLRADPVMTSFLSPRPRDEVSTGEALAFARALIRVTSQRGPRINRDIRVSETCDCGLLRFDTGFDWIPEKGDPIPSTPRSRD